MKDRKLKLCMACSAGGHLTEMVHLKKCYSKYSRFFITFKRIDTEEFSKKEKVYFVPDPGRNPMNFLKCVFQTFNILLKEKPDVVVSTGAGVAIPACYMSKFLLGSKIIFVESFCRIEEPSLSGRIVYPISDMFLVQWFKLLKKYGGKAVYRGAIV
jgi:beta-1,4-N-acetylglucosaminyltransferase